MTNYTDADQLDNIGYLFVGFILIFISMLLMSWGLTVGNQGLFVIGDLLLGISLFNCIQYIRRIIRWTTNTRASDR